MKKVKLKQSENFYIRKVLAQTPLKDIMTTPVVSLRIDAPFYTVAEKIMKGGIRHLPIVDYEDKLKGLITQRDLFKIQPPRRLDDGTLYYDKETLNAFVVAHVMTKDPFSLPLEASVADAVVIMARKKFGCIPIVQKDKMLCGIVTQTDILQIAAQIIEE